MESSIPSPPPEPAQSFNIAQHYLNLLSTDPEITKPIAAIESLIALISTTPSSTVSETLSLIETSSKELKTSIPNSTALTAGTELFQRYIIYALQSQPSTRKNATPPHTQQDGTDRDFAPIRNHLTSDSKIFAQTAHAARLRIARLARQILPENGTFLTFGRSRVVAQILEHAAESAVDFKLVRCSSGSSEPCFGSFAHAQEARSSNMIKALRDKEVPVAITGLTGLAIALEQSCIVLVGAECVLENGGIISSLGTRQLALLAKSADVPFYVCAESHKFARIFPHSSADLGLEQNVVMFETDKDARSETHQNTKSTGQRVGSALGIDDRDQLDYTPPELITSIISEVDIQPTNAIAEELMRL